MPLVAAYLLIRAARGSMPDFTRLVEEKTSAGWISVIYNTYESRLYIIRTNDRFRTLVQTGKPRAYKWSGVSRNRPSENSN